MSVTHGNPHYPIAEENLPATWVVEFLGEAIRDLRNGVSKGEVSRVAGGIPQLRPMNIDREGRLMLAGMKYVPENLGPDVRGGDVIFNNTNSRELVGKAAAVDGDGQYAVSRHMTRLRPPKGLSHRFVAYQLHYLWMSSYFRYRSTQHVNQASISEKTLSETVPFILAPTGEQLRIVAEIEKQFSRLNAAEAGFDTVKTKSKEYIRSLLEQACSGRLVPPEAELARGQSRSYESANALRTRLVRAQLEKEVDSEQRGLFDQEEEVESVPGPHALPEGWTWARICELGVSQLGRQRSPEHQTGEHIRPYLRVANVFEDRIDTSDVLKMNFTPKEFEIYRLEPGDILLNEGQSVELVGRPAMYQGEVPGACFQNTLVRFRASDGVVPRYALIVFRHYLHSKRFQAIARWSTNIAHLGLGRFVEIEFPLPPTAEQSRIVTEFERLASLSAKQSSTVDSLSVRCAMLRHSILHQAYTGKLVPQDPNEGNAADLLRRIREEFARAAAEPKPFRPSRSSSRKSGGRKNMSKRQSLIDALIRTRDKLSPEELFKQCGFDDETVDEFFDELKREMGEGRIQQHKTRDGIWLKAAN
jgi:type I restriction enzyme, S subunit